MGVVEQIINGSERARLDKETLAAPLPSGGAVAMVRKRLPGAEPRGAVMLIHGFGQNRYTFHLERRSFSAFLAARGYDVFNLELRGHGRSRELGSGSPEAFEEHVEEDVPAALDLIAASGHPRPFILGHSLGGAVAYATAGHDPDRVRGVVTVSGVYQWGGGAPAMTVLSRALSVADRVHRRAGLGRGPAVRMDWIGQTLARNIAVVESKWFPRFMEGWVPGSVERRILREWLNRAFDRTSGSVLALMGRWGATGRFDDSHGRVDYGERWSRSRVPALIIAGDRDRLASEEDVRPAFAAATTADRTYRCFGSEGAPYGHIDLLIGRRAPAEVWPYILDWLDSHSDA